jgi:hypothetical protein
MSKEGPSLGWQRRQANSPGSAGRAQLLLNRLVAERSIVKMWDRMSPSGGRSVTVLSNVGVADFDTRGLGQSTHSRRMGSGDCT